VSCGLRDVLGFEAMGRPAVLVCSSAFAQTAADQSAALGAPALRRVTVDHPVQDRTDDELTRLAVSAIEELLAALSA